MADPRAQPEQEEDIEGATPRELLIEAARANNTDLLHEVIAECADTKAAATLLNNTKTVMGNYLYHEAALRGNYEIIDILLDQEDFECDPIHPRSGDTPLHSAVRWVNESGPEAWEYGQQLIDMMLEAGSDPRIRNKAHLTAADLTDPKNTKLKQRLEDAVYDVMNAGDFVEAEKEDTGLDFADEVDDDDKSVGSASDSDFDQEEYKRFKEEEKAKKAAAATAP